MTTCQRKAIIALVLGLACLALGTIGHLQHWPMSDRILGMLAGFGAGGVFSAALMWWMPDMSDAVPKALARRYYRELTPPMLGYVAVMLAWKQLLGAVDAAWLRLLIALVPGLLIAWIMRAFVRYVRDSDEMQRRIELESGAISGLLVSGVYMAAGFVQMAGLIDVPAKAAMLWVFPLFCFAYGIIKVVNARRYQ